MRGRVLVMVVAVLLTAGCGRAEPSITSGQMLREYAGATAPVKNDRFTSGGSGEDRLANFAAYYSRDQLAAALFAAYECDDSSAGAPNAASPSNPCQLSGDVTEAAQEFTGSDDRPNARSILVKHADGSLELITVYIARRGEDALLIDANGDTYTDLEDFRSGNDLLSNDDTILTLRDVTSVPGSGEFAVRTGHTPAVWPWVASGAAGAVLVVLITLAVIRRRRAAAENAELLAHWEPEKPREPATPLEPQGPATPLEPQGPATPLEPQGPATPQEPPGQATPQEPARPEKSVE